jgi:hypothetical protein
MVFQQQVRIIRFSLIIFPSQQYSDLICCVPGRVDCPRGGMTMQYEQTGSRKTQLIAMLMTFAVVGGVIAYVM